MHSRCYSRWWMLKKRRLNLRIGARLRTILEERALASGLAKPLPGILWGKWDDEKDEYYSIGFYEGGDLPVNDPIRIIEADGIEFLITQDWICEDLEGKLLDLIQGKLAVLDK